MKVLMSGTILKVGSKIEACQKAKRLTILTLADKCEVYYSQISRMERGKVNFTFLSLLKIAIALDIDLKELIP